MLALLINIMSLKIEPQASLYWSNPTLRTALLRAVGGLGMELASQSIFVF